MKTILKLLIALILVLVISYATEVMSPAVENGTGDQANNQADAWSAKYIHPYDNENEWPPKYDLLDQVFSCPDAVATSSPTLVGSPIFYGGRAVQKTIHGRTYCITASSEGAAGSTYTTYSYASASTVDASRTTRIWFTLRAVQCGNYNEPEKTACEMERAAFNVDLIVDRLAKVR